MTCGGLLHRGKAPTATPNGRSRALEPEHKTPLLGMEAAWSSALDGEGIFDGSKAGVPNPHVAEWRKAWPQHGGTLVTLDAKDVVDATSPRSTTQAVHGCFDNHVGCVERTIQRILGLASVTELPVRITSLKGF